MGESSAREALRQEILDKAVVRGKVVLSSGKEADYYVDLRRVTLDAVAAPLVGEVMVKQWQEAGLRKPSVIKPVLTTIEK